VESPGAWSLENSAAAEAWAESEGAWSAAAGAWSVAAWSWENSKASSVVAAGVAWSVLENSKAVVAGEPPSVLK
jgi:hypothetical protein